MANLALVTAGVLLLGLRYVVLVRAASAYGGAGSVPTCIGLNAVADVNQRDYPGYSVVLVINGTVQDGFAIDVTSSSYPPPPLGDSGLDRSATVSFWFDLSRCAGADASSSRVRWAVAQSASVAPDDDDPATAATQTYDEATLRDTTELSVAGIDPAGGSLLAGEVSSFDVEFECNSSYVVSAEFTFAFWPEFSAGDADGDGQRDPVAIVGFAIRWRCHHQGCPDYCEMHGMCDELGGLCICYGDYSGDGCEAVLDVPEEICPYEPLMMSWYIPANMAGLDRPLSTLWFGLEAVEGREATPTIIEWRYILTWSSDTPSEDDPRIDEDNSGEGYIYTPLQPSVYKLYFATDLDYTLYVEHYITVLEYGLCGIDGQCYNSSSSNTCNFERNYGVCEDNYCHCQPGHYMYDCSRGCSAFTSYNESLGVIYSDTPSTSPEDMRYAALSNCKWLVSMKDTKFDIIELNFTFVEIDSADAITLFYTDGEGNIADSFTSITSPVLVEVKANQVIVQLKTGGSTSDPGFVVEFKGKRQPLAAVVVGFIIVVCILAVICAVIASIFGIAFAIRRHRRHLRAAQNAPAKLLPHDLDHESMAAAHNPSTTIEISEQILVENHLRADKLQLDFGLKVGDAFPVDSPLTDTLSLNNLGSHPVPYCFYVPDQPHLMQLQIYPGEGVIPSQGSVNLRVTFALLYTAHIEHSIRLQIGESGIYLPLRFEGAVSQKIDPEEIMLDPVPLAAGSFGSVFKGVYRSQLVAVKILKHQEAFRESERRDFQEECNLMRQLRHPYIVNFIGASFVAGKYCICTEFIDHGSLDSLLQTDEDIPYLLVLNFATNISEAMQFLHESRILYRDLKCSNVLLVSTSTTAHVNCKLADFGTARNVENPDEVMHYTCGMGTPIYMAPEMIASKPYNYKLDVFSFGMALWEMWCREEPWADIPSWDVPGKVLTGQRPDIPSDCPRNYAKLIKKCWNQEPEGRLDFLEISEVLEGMKKDVTESMSNKRRSRRISMMVEKKEDNVWKRKKIKKQAKGHDIEMDVLQESTTTKQHKKNTKPNNKKKSKHNSKHHSSTEHEHEDEDEDNAPKQPQPTTVHPHKKRTGGGSIKQNSSETPSGTTE
ncbi:Serine/threonine-protein kinase [Pelomyxa schiedti]|nr:Serine/threonine-protein kinase [Pelomyxa schiedti]